MEDNDHFRGFIGIGRIRENVSSDVNARDDKEIGRFGVGKNSYLGFIKALHTIPQLLSKPT
jgi:hypothetical protein